MDAPSPSADESGSDPDGASAHVSDAASGGASEAASGRRRAPRARSGGHDDLAGGGRKGRGRRNRKRPKSLKRRILTWSVLGLSVIILATAGAGYLYYRHLNGNLGKDDLSLGEHKLGRSEANADGQRPLNILLLGSDSRASDKNVKLGGSHADRERPPLADVQMLLHVSADRSNMSVVSIPRDTKVEIPKCTDTDDDQVYPATTDKINSSLQHGGPGCTVATWENLTGVPVDHFMMIDFSGVVSMADAVGGVPVCVKDNVYDRKSGLRLEEGESVVKGEQALQWLRTRHGFGDGTDIGRAKAQHMYMSAMVRQLKSGAKLTDAGKLRKLAEAATKALTVDHGLGSVKKLYDLANDLKQVPTKRITMATMPWEYSAGGSYVVPKEGDAEKTFSMVRQDIALDGKDKKKAKGEGPKEPGEPAAPKAEINVRVMNGTAGAAQAPVRGRAATVASYLTEDGFSQAAAEQTPRPQADTSVSYAQADQRGDALAVAKALNIPERLVKHSAAAQDVTLVVGADWRTGAEYPKSEGDGDGKGDGKTPDTADALNGDDKNACMEVNPNNVW
ncbi:LCP family protein [Streptomyces sp. N2-109]|uniref:LCP family protein n=1 Tax=Streptomyces gossypii TaxID=2883101 RepID=A0ABT2K0E2_9ACTN|nr:LCP family protein [Streptomyces gossypii]MCT2593618.1 LCP family protein [Streptomyces gossypii]